MLSEINQSEKDKYHVLSLICGNKQNTTRGMDTRNRLTDLRGERSRGTGRD